MKLTCKFRFPSSNYSIWLVHRKTIRKTHIQNKIVLKLSVVQRMNIAISRYIFCIPTFITAACLSLSSQNYYSFSKLQCYCTSCGQMMVLLFLDHIRRQPSHTLNYTEKKITHTTQTHLNGDGKQYLFCLVRFDFT